MFSEQLTEKGQVIEKSGKKIRIQINSPANCEDCSAKIFCNSSEGRKIVEVSSSKSFNEGDEVKIFVKGSQIVKFSFLYYGIPLVLLVTGIIISYYFIKNSNIKELLSFFSGLMITIIYYTVLFFAIRNKSRNHLSIEISKAE